MSSSITATFWGAEANSDQLVRQLGHELHGIDRRHSQAQHILHTDIVKDKGLNARQVFQFVRGGAPKMDVQDVDFEHEPSPDLPNVFNDGSLKVPSNQYWGLGGLGVWWDRRIL